MTTPLLPSSDGGDRKKTRLTEQTEAMLHKAPPATVRRTDDTRSFVGNKGIPSDFERRLSRRAVRFGTVDEERDTNGRRQAPTQGQRAKGLLRRATSRDA